MTFSGTLQKCKVCNKVVHFIEMLTADGVPYHKTCFKCSHCNGLLAMSSYSSLEGVLYCKPHFEQLFKETGSYTKKLQSSGKPNDMVESPVVTKPLVGPQPQTAPCSASLDLRESFSLKSTSESKNFCFVQTRTPSKLSAFFSGTQEKCAVCHKTVYPLEKVTVEEKNYHKLCFRCAHGGCKLTPSSYAALDGYVYCKPHFAQLFKEKGSYTHLTKTASVKKNTVTVPEIVPPELSKSEPET